MATTNTKFENAKIKETKKSFSEIPEETFYSQRQKVVNNYDWKKEKEKMMSKFLKGQREGKSLKTLYEEAVPQGITFSHNVQFPVINNMLEAVSNGFSAGENGYYPFLSPERAKEMLIGLFLAMLVLVLISQSPVNRRSQKQKLTVVSLRFFLLSSICFIMTMVTFFPVMKANDDLNRMMLHYWEHLHLYRNMTWEEFRDLELNRDAHNTDEGIGMEPVFPQGIEEFIPEASAFTAVLITAISGVVPKNSVINAMLAATRTTQTQCSNMSTFFLMSMTKIASFFNSIEMSNIASYFEVGISLDSEVNKYVKTVTDFVASTNAGNMNSYIHFQSVYDAYTESGKKLLLNVQKNSYDYRLISNLLKELRDSYSKNEIQRNAMNGTRVEPVAILIKGKPGCFKSALAQRISSIVSKFTLPTEWREEFDQNPKDFIFSLPNDKWFEGYGVKSWFVLADDLFQARDSVGSVDSDALKVIKIVNTQPYPLPMADVSLKGSQFFRSPFFIATTNLTNWHSLESVINSEAVQRRFQLEVEVVPNSKYVNKDNSIRYEALPVLDIETDDGTISGTSIPEDFWNITVVKKTANSKHEPMSVTFNDLVYMIIKEHQFRIKNFYVNKEAEKNIATKSFKEIKVSEELRDLYSKMFMDIARPQSGLFSDVPPSLGLMEVWSCLSKEMRQSITSSIYNTVVDYDAIPGVEVNFDIIEVFNLVKRYNKGEEMAERLQAKDIRRINAIVSTVIELSLDRDENPFTLKPLIPIKEPSKTEILVNRIFKFMKETSSTILKYLKKYHMWFIMGVPLVLSSAYYLAKIFSNVVPVEEEDQPVAQSADYSRDRAKTPGKRVPNSLSKNINNMKIRSQGNDVELKEEDINYLFDRFKVEDLGCVNTLNNVLSTVINKYLFIMYLVTDGNAKRIGHAVNIQGKTFAIPMHFLYQLVDFDNDPRYEDSSIVLTTATHSTKFDCSLNSFLKSFRTTDDMADRDIALFQMNSAHPNSKGILNYILKEADIERLRNESRQFNGTLLGTYNKKWHNNVLLIRATNLSLRFHGDLVVKAEWKSAPKNEVYMLSEVVTYDSSFASGDCGSILSVNSTKFENRCILGFHVAGTEGVGFSTVFSQESMRKLIEETDFGPSLVIEDNLPSSVIDYPVSAQGYKKPVAYLTGNDIPTTVSSSEYKRSLLFGKLPYPFTQVDHYPARLREFSVLEDGIEITKDPMKIAMVNYGKHAKSFDQSKLDSSIDSYEELITLHMKDKLDTRTVIPIKEALHNFRNVKSISSSTSAGYPMSLPKEENIKKLYYKAIFDNDQVKIDSIFQRIAKEVEDRIYKYSEGIRVPVLYKDVLKDELRKKEKVVSGQTRMFSACEFTYLLMCRMYFGAFMSSFFGVNYRIGSAVGVNPYSESWDVVARELLKFSGDPSVENIGAGDYKHYDSDQYPQVLWSIFGMIQRWYGKTLSETDKKIQFMLFSEIVNSRHVNGSDIYEWQSGIPSGNPLTTMVNCIYNHIMFRMAFILSGHPINSFNNNVYLIVLGDDNLFSASKEVAENFNELKLPGYMSQLHMTYTTELKDAATQTFRKLTEVEFLKRSFRFDRTLNRYVAPINLQSIFRPLNWTKKGDGSSQQVVDQISSSLLELSLHGKYVFEEYSSKLFELKDHYYPNVTPNLQLTPNYKAVYNRALSLTYEW